MKSVAILLDGGFVTKKLYKMLGRHATANDVLEFSEACLKQDEELFRLYYYDCQPDEQTQTNPISGASTGLTPNIHIWWFVGAIRLWLPLSIVSLRKS